jgi:hypothetical protein
MFYSKEEDSEQLAQVIPAMRKLLENEKGISRTPRDAAYLSVARAIIEFLEEIPKKADPQNRGRSKQGQPISL